MICAVFNYIFEVAEDSFIFLTRGLSEAEAPIETILRWGVDHQIMNIKIHKGKPMSKKFSN